MYVSIFILTHDYVFQVIQRRLDGSVDFFKTWNEYKIGFGDVTGEFWLGNEYISDITSSNYDYVLRIELTSYNGEKRFAEYSHFSVGTSEYDYKLHVGSYLSGSNAGEHKCTRKDSVNTVTYIT